MIHSIKILPEYYTAVKNGLKKIEVRFNDNDVLVGDYIILKEWNGDNYTGRVIKCLVTKVLEDIYCKILPSNFIIVL